MKITVVGAGIAGLSTAWALAKRGHAVTLFEQGPVPNPLSASGDHHRIIRRAYPASSGYAPMITEAYRAWDELWADLGETHLDARGFLCVSREEGDEAEIYRGGLESGGFPFDIFDADEAVRRWPFLARDGIRYAYFSPEGGALHCRAIAAGMASWLGEKGANVKTRRKVVAIDADAGIVRLEGGQVVEADRVVATAGAWVTKLFPDLAAELTTYRTAVAYLDPPRDLVGAWAAAPVILDVGGTIDGYIIPPSGGSGLKFGTGRHKRRHVDADADRAPGEGEGRAILEHFRPAILDIDDYGVRKVSTCAYTFTADETFFCEQRGRVLIVSACSGHGYKFGAAVGRRVADCVENGDPDRLARWLRADTG